MNAGTLTAVGRRSIVVLAGLAACLLEAASPTQPGITTWLTHIKDGDVRDARLNAPGATGTFDARQDDGFTLFRCGTISPGSPDRGQSLRIVLDRSKTFQTMLGHGAAMTDSSAWVLMNLKRHHPALFEHVMKRLFSPTEGAGFSFLRLPMGASDYTATAKLYTYCDEISPDLAKFSIAHDHAYIIPALKEAIRLNPEIRILGSPWSPPAWMKTNGKLEGVTEAEKQAGATCRLKPQYFEAYADYFVKFIEAYQAAGLEIWGVTPQNEPQFDTAHYPCLRMDEADQIQFVRLLGPKLAARKLTTRIFIHDHNWAIHENDRRAIHGDAKLDPVASVTQILSDPVAGPYIAGSAWHCYFGGVKEMRHAYHSIQERFPDKQLLCTELSAWGRNRGAWFGDVQWGLTHNWMGGPQHGCAASLQWNLVLDHRFGPTLRPDSAAVGLVAVNTERWDSARFEREFYAMAHLSQAARPGSVRISTEFAGTPASDLETIAFASKDGRASLVVFNQGNQERAFGVEDGKTRFNYTLPGRSMATFVW